MEKNDNFKSDLENQYTILIQAQERSEQRRFLAILVVITVTLLAVIVNAVFSFMAYKRSSDIQEDVKDEKTYYQTLSTVYNGSSSLVLDNIVTGYRLGTPKTIEITNDGDTAVTYNIKIASIKTSLLSTNNLFYTINSNGETSSTKQLPLTDKVILDNIKIEPKETRTYTIDVVFQGTTFEGENNNYYHASIIVEQMDNKSNLLEQ